jgi:hypothetical protein
MLDWIACAFGCFLKLLILADKNNCGRLIVQNVMALIGIIDYGLFG